MHSDSLYTILETFKTQIDRDGGLFPEDFSSEDVLFLYEMAFQLYEVEQYKKSEEVFRRLVIAKPGEPNFWQGLASSLQMQGKYDEALVPWSMFCIVDPENPLPHYYAAECLFSIGQREQALKALKASEVRDMQGEFLTKIGLLRRAWEEKSDV